MIPRYTPTYSYADLIFSLKNGNSNDFEKNLSGKLQSLFGAYGAKYIFLFASARAGIYAVLKAYDRPGKVLLPAYNCIAVPEAIIYAGYQPAFVDIDIATLNVSPNALEKALKPDTTALLLTHLFGIPCEMAEIRSICKNRNILIIEDAAPAFGAEYNGKMVGCFGDASVISFHSTKVISGGGGGALITNNDMLAESIEKYLSVIKKTEISWLLFLKSIAYKTALNPKLYTVLRLGYRMFHLEQMYEVVKASLVQPDVYISRMSAFTCALIDKQLNRLDWNLHRRRRVAEIYREHLGGSSNWSLPEIPASAVPSWIQFPLICHDKLAFYKYMQSKGVDLSWTYKYSCAESFGLDNFPNSVQAAKNVVSLPTSPYLTDEQAYQICSKAVAFHQA